MAFNRENTLKEAERLLRQGRVQAALAELQKVAQRNPNDLPILNRMGDLLAKQGRQDEAIEYYERIAQGFKRGGFLPKSVAIYKKILRLDPDRLEALTELGELFLTQELPGEARGYLLRAADVHLREQRFPEARTVFERLVEAEPGDARHRARLAEVRAAEGDVEQAAAELLGLAASLRQREKPAEAEQTYRRAAELAPNRPEPVIGLAGCLFDLGSEEKAFAVLEQARQGKRTEPAILGELAFRHHAAERSAEAFELVLPAAGQVPIEACDRLFREGLRTGTIDAIWAAYDEHTAEWSDDARRERLLPLLERLISLERGGHLPCLERLLAIHEALGNDDETAVTLERLVRGYEGRSMHYRAAQTRERLGKLRPDSDALKQAAAGAAQAKSSRPSKPARGAATVASALPEVDDARLREAEHPSTPESRADHDYINGRMTQAEIFEKYGLHDKAVEQLREATGRFPGHVEAQRRLVEGLERNGETEALVEALVGLAIAQRAAGKTAEARKAAGRAAARGALDGASRALLVRLALVDAATASAAPGSEGLPEPSAPARRAAAPEVVIDFDVGEEEETPAAAEEPTPQPEPEPEPEEVRTPDPKLLAEVQRLIEGGNAGEAGRRIAALKVLGYAGAEIERLEAACAALGPAAKPAARRTAMQLPEPGLDDDDDLSAITAALESELFLSEDEPAAAAPESESQESLEEVFAAFKQQVQAEVEEEDYRTHYDLGIAYKEMGLVDDAIGEFQIAIRDDSLKGEASSMLALCHRERGDSEQAAHWYREALSAASLDDETVCGLRYDLADLLVGSGDAEGALDLFREVLQSDPGYRDVQSRVTELETRLGS